MESDKKVPDTPICQNASVQYRMGSFEQAP